MPIRTNLNEVYKLSKNPKFYVFTQCLEKYKISELLDKSKFYTFFIPDNLCFVKDIKNLDPLGDEEIKKIIMAHIVPQKLTNLRVSHSYATISNNKLIKLTRPKLINNKANIIKGPETIQNFTIYCIDEVLC